MEHLGMLANRGHTIIASIHQPRPAIFDRFNKVVVLSEGHQIYMGPPSLTVDWFHNHLGYSYSVARDGNVPDWIMDTVSIGFHKPATVAARCAYCMMIVLNLDVCLLAVHFASNCPCFDSKSMCRRCLLWPCCMRL